jgi:hypothetical protein
VADWGALSLLGAFVVGIVFGVIIALRILKLVWESARNHHRRRED